MRDADLAPLTLAAAQTAKQQCINLCRARYRACFSLKHHYVAVFAIGLVWCLLECDASHASWEPKPHRPGD
jgi:hypothetical protein